MAKPLQVGFAAAAGVRAARLAGDGASTDPSALEDWLELLGGDPAGPLPEVPAIPDGLAVKVYPCCYALQRPIAAMAGLELAADQVTGIHCRTPAACLKPLIHHRPETGLEGKFSLEYGLAAALLDRPVGLVSFTDAAVRRPAAQRLVNLVEVDAIPGGSGLLDGECDLEVTLWSGGRHHARLAVPPGAPGCPPVAGEMREKVEDCCGPLAATVLDLDWKAATELMSSIFPSVGRWSS